MSFISVEQRVKDGDAYTVTTGLNQISGTTETAYLYLKNPSGSAKSIMITHFKFGTDSASCRSLLRIYGNPTVSANGTSLTIANTKIMSSTPSSSMEAYRSPTVTANGGVLNLDISPANSPSKGLNRWYFVEPGNSLLVTVDNSQANADSFADIYWIEGV